MSISNTYCFLINCASNVFRAERNFEEQQDYLASEFPDAEFIYIREDDSIKDIAQQKAVSFTHIVACGGDGTVNQAANGLLGADATLGVIPLGSGNDIAQSLGLDGSFEQAVKVLKTNKSYTIDLVQTNWGYFLNTMGIGVDGATNLNASKSIFKSGTLRYFWGGLKALFLARPFNVSIHIFDNPELQLLEKVWMVAVANGKNEGGKYTISPTSSNSDGEVELVIVHDVSRVRLIFEFLKLSFGFSFNPQVVSNISFKNSIEIQVEKPQPAHADGEHIPTFTDGRFTVIPGALKVVYRA